MKPHQRLNTEDKYFESNEFKVLLQRYEQAEAEGKSVYMEPDELSDIAEYYYQKGNIEAARQAVGYALQLFPDATEPLAFRARLALLVDNDISQARQFAEQIADKSDLEYHYLVAEIMLADNKADEAGDYLKQHYDELYDQTDKDDYPIDVANLFADYDQYEKAARWLRLTNDTEATDYKELKGRIAIQLGHYDESERIFNQLIDDNPYATPYWNRLATTQFLQNNIHDSIQSSEFSIAINPDNDEAILNKANGLFSLGNIEEAADYYHRFSLLCPDDEAGPMFEGICRLNMGQNEEAVALLRQAERLAPEDSEYRFDIYQELAFALSQAGHTDEALEIYRMLIAVDDGGES